MEFRLVYTGKLPAAGGKDKRAAEKQAIRKQLRPQLKHLWTIQPPLSRWLTQTVFPGNSSSGIKTTVAEEIASQYAHNGFSFLPLVSSKFSLACELDILFLRRDAPGQLIHSDGDLDNRIKVLLDGLRMPKDRNELAGATPDSDEVPFFVLLEDDKLVTTLKVTTDRLLTPAGNQESNGHVHLIIQVNV